MTRWINEPAKVGGVEVGEFWRNQECDGCAKTRATLTLELWEDYEQGSHNVELCAQCLRDLAGSLDTFEAQPENDD